MRVVFTDSTKRERERDRQEIHYCHPQETAEVFSRRAIPRMSDVWWNTTWERLKAVGLLPSCILTALIFYHGFSFSAASLKKTKNKKKTHCCCCSHCQEKKGSERKVQCWSNESHPQRTASSCATAVHDFTLQWRCTPFKNKPVTPVSVRCNQTGCKMLTLYLAPLCVCVIHAVMGITWQARCVFQSSCRSSEANLR